MTTYFYVRPTDSLFVRGNLAFGDAGEHGASLMPPPPSLFAGAFRSAILGRNADRLAAFLAHGRCADPSLDACLGTAEAPGAFRLTWLTLAGRKGARTPEAVVALPADLLQLESGLAPLAPQEPAALVTSSGELPLRATLTAARQEKPLGGVYLRQSGIAHHLSGERPLQADTIAASQMHARDPRLGIGLSTESRSAEEGLIYTTEGYAFALPADAMFDSTGFLVGIAGVRDLLPDSGMLRLGGDGRSAHYQRTDFEPAAPPVQAIAARKRFRLVLNTPGLFPDGWHPPGIARGAAGDFRLVGDGFAARFACAALGRREIFSGWNLFDWKPKDAEAAAPAGSVYWFDGFEGDIGKLAAWVANGFQAENASNSPRRAEGFNIAWLGAWV